MVAGHPTVIRYIDVIRIYVREKSITTRYENNVTGNFLSAIIFC